MLDVAGTRRAPESIVRVRAGAGITIHVADHAPACRPDGPPVVLLHGLLTSGDVWRHLVPALRRRRRVIVPDLRGHGRSGPPRKDVFLDELIDDLLAVLDALDVRCAALIGLSLGGVVCLHTALRAPDRVAALGLVATPASSEAAEGRARQLRTLDAMERIGTRPVLRGMAGWLFGRAMRRERPDVVDAWLDVIEAAEPVALRRTAQAGLRRPDARPWLARVHAPTLVVVGAEDAVLPHEEAQALARGIRGAALCELARAGHLVPLERPRALLAAIRSGLRIGERPAPSDCGVDGEDYVRTFA